MSEQKRPPHRWAKGQSGNPAGRKPVAPAFAAAVRRIVDPHELAEAMAEIVFNPKHAARDRIAAATMLADRGWPRPLRLEATISAVPRLPDNWREMSEGARAAFLAELAVRGAVEAEADDEQQIAPRVIDVLPVGRDERRTGAEQARDGTAGVQPASTPTDPDA